MASPRPGFRGSRRTARTPHSRSRTGRVVDRALMNINIQEDIDRLGHGIRLLKVQYDQYFAGGLKRQPLELRWQMEKII